jgi:hypothetical protein
MSKVFQVRYTVGDKTVAHEHYTEKGAKIDAKALSKAIGNAMIGEIDILEETGAKSLVRVWEFSGGESSKPIKKEGAPPSEVEILKTADETRLTETTTEKKPKAPKMSTEEKIAAKKAEYEAGLAAIAAGTFVLKTPGKKPVDPDAPKKPKTETDKVAKLIESLGCTERAARILNEIGTTTVSRRAKVAAWIIDHNGSIAASEIMQKLSDDPKEEEEVTIKKVISAANFVSYLFSKHDQPWRITVKSKGEETFFNFVPVKIEYQGANDEETEVVQQAEVA